MTEIEIRRVRTDDVSAVIALVRDVLSEFGLSFGQGSATDTELHDLPASYDSRGGAFWVALSGGEICGTCGVSPVGEGVYELRKMYLHPSSRGRGLGQKLLDEAIRWTRDKGARRLVLDTVHEMTRAITFYEANGFIRDDGQIRGARCSRGYRLDL